MTFRIFYAIQQSWHFRNALKRYIVDPSLQLKSVRDITAAYLAAAGVNALALDYDGVLAAHGEPTPRPETITWLQEFSRAYAPHKIYILSNKPNPDRIEYFRQHFPSITFMPAMRKKPYPDGMQQIINLSGLPGSQIMLVDDRLCTGILATLIAGTQARWITVPYVNFFYSPFAEIGFIILRWLEHVILKY